MYSPEEKSDSVRSILEGSTINDDEHEVLITEVLMRIPDKARYEIDSSLDHIVYGALLLGAWLK